ncbi:hypothetical protein UO65_3014 [Actinokineospora spheciospongiae]|uniref:Uncharacterized protein n=1 Tax=Actinokineospora spheciospongiae TaxID=909613 RepID=W7IYU3_9PSEU|nr:hypothetical protein UO65_3014 [Actinokineospora spheciospongiae]
MSAAFPAVVGVRTVMPWSSSRLVGTSVSLQVRKWETV